jgi:hypothetical protein
MKRLIVLLSLLGCSLVPLVGHAQSRPAKTPGPLVIADQYFREGVFDKALIEYQKAFEDTYDPAIYYNIAQCLHRLEHYQKAILYYELFISKNHASPLISHVQSHIAECARKLLEAQKFQEAHTRVPPGTRKVAVVSEPVGAEVYVDSFTGAPVGVTPLMLELDTTPHLIVLRKAGYKDFSQLVDVGVPGMTLLRFTLEDVNRRPTTTVGHATVPSTPGGALPGGDPPPTTVRPAELTGQWWFWTGLATTSVFTLSGIMTGLRTLDLKSQFDDTGDTSYKDRGERYRAWTDLLIGGALVAGIATGVGIVLFHRAPSGTSSNTRAGLSVLPACGPGACGLTLQFTF